MAKDVARHGRARHGVRAGESAGESKGGSKGGSEGESGRASLHVLELQEPARFDPTRLERLCADIGEVRAESEVAHALERISALLGRLHSLAEEQDSCHLRRALLNLRRDADLIGMASLARVSADVLTCLEWGDRQGTQATLARLDRVGDRSIHAIWELEDLSG